MCKYCENGKLIYPSVADNWFDYCIEIFIENNRMVIMLGNGDVIVKINACPMCGRRLSGDAE